MFHAISEVVEEITSTLFHAVEIPNAYFSFACFLSAKLWTACSPIFLVCWRLEVGVLNVGCHEVKAHQSGIGEGNTNALSRHDYSVGAFFWVGIFAPLATKRAFIIKFIFTSNIIWHSRKVCLDGIAWSLLRNWKATRLFFIYLLIESRQSVFPASLLSIYASFTVLGTSTPYLCVFFFKWALTAPIICSRLLSVKGFHQAKVGSDMSLLDS